MKIVKSLCWAAHPDSRSPLVVGGFTPYYYNFRSDHFIAFTYIRFSAKFAKITIANFSKTNILFCIMFCACHTTLTQNGSVCILLSGRTTTTGRMFGPKVRNMALLSCFPKTQRCVITLGVESKFRILITSQVFYQLLSPAAVITSSINTTCA